MEESLSGKNERELQDEYMKCELWIDYFQHHKHCIDAAIRLLRHIKLMEPGSSDSEFDELHELHSTPSETKDSPKWKRTSEPVFLTIDKKKLDNIMD